MAHGLWTDTENDVLRALTVQVRTLSLDQIVRGWFAPGQHTEQQARNLITNLIRAKLICRQIVEAHPLNSIKRPLFSWRPGKPAPNVDMFSELSKKSCGRWMEAEKPVEVFVASKIAIRLFGAFGSARDANPWAKEVYQRISANQKNRKKKAIVAVARKLLVRCWAMLLHETPWNGPTTTTLSEAAPA